MISDISNLERINFTECISKDGISENCAKSIDQYKYVVNDGKALRTHARLVSRPESRYDRSRSINTDFLLLPGTEFSMSNNNETVYSKSLYPEKMEYPDERLHDCVYKPTPTNGISHLPNPYVFDLNKLETTSDGWLNSNVSQYNPMYNRLFF